MAIGRSVGLVVISIQAFMRSSGGEKLSRAGPSAVRAACLACRTPLVGLVGLVDGVACLAHRLAAPFPARIGSVRPMAAGSKSSVIADPARSAVRPGAVPEEAMGGEERTEGKRQ